MLWLWFCVCMCGCTSMHIRVRKGDGRWRSLCTPTGFCALCVQLWVSFYRTWVCVCVFLLRLCCSMARSPRRTRMDLWATAITGLMLSSSWYSALSLLTWENNSHLPLSMKSLSQPFCCDDFSTITPLESGYSKAWMNLSDLLIACCHAGPLPLHTVSSDIFPFSNYAAHPLSLWRL